jgi:hypothetical protein
MTPEDRDVIRAEASMRVLAAMYVNWIHLAAPRDESEEQKKARERARSIRRMEYALEAANVADALIAELQVREEHDPDAPPTIESLVREGIAAGGTILSCTHGVPSYEPCAKCDEADAAEKSGKTGGESADPA